MDWARIKKGGKYALQKSFKNLDDWEVASSFQDLMEGAEDPEEKKEILDLSVSAVLKFALFILRNPKKMLKPTLVKKEENPDSHAEVRIEESFENAFDRGTLVLEPQDLILEEKKRVVRKFLLLVDTSLSMKGEMRAITAAALAVVFLGWQEEEFAVIGFENEARTLLGAHEKVSAYEFIRRFLLFPKDGYTHIENALKAGISELASGKYTNAFLITDGVVTAGNDPFEWAGRFDALHVIRIGQDPRGEVLCRRIAQKGKGIYQEIPDDRALPGLLLKTIRSLSGILR